MPTPQQGNLDLQNPTTGNVLAINADGSIPVGPETAPADALAIATLLPALRMAISGTGVASIERVPNVFKPVNAQALTATGSNTPVSIWTPATGKKFRLLGYWFSISTAAGLVFHDLATVGGTGVMPCPSPIAAAAGIVMSPPMGLGILSATINNQLWVDATTGTPSITGFVWGVEE